jgi:hypothetical protein
LGRGQVSAVFLQAGLDDYGAIKVVNYIRANVQQGKDPRADLAAALHTADKPWDHERYLIPVLQDDGLLCHDFWENFEYACCRNKHLL